jgi:hypothetical protein
MSYGQNTWTKYAKRAPSAQECDKNVDWRTFFSGKGTKCAGGSGASGTI